MWWRSCSIGMRVGRSCVCLPTWGWIRRRSASTLPPAEAEGIRPGDGLVLDRAGWAAKVAVWFPELTDSRARSSTWPTLEARRDLISKMLETNTLATVWWRWQLIKTWPRAERGRRTDPADYPPEKIAFFMRTPTF